MVRFCRLATLLIVFGGLLLGCTSSSEITHAWFDPDLKGKEYDGVLVIAVMNNETERADFENAFAAALKKKGIRAVPSYPMPASNAKDDQAIALAKKANLDGILLTRYIGEIAKQDVYHPGTIYYGVTPAYGPYRGRFGGYYGHAYEIARTAPVWSTNTTVAMVSDLFATETGAHLWQASSQAIDMGRMKENRNIFITGFIKLMREQKLLD